MKFAKTLTVMFWGCIILSGCSKPDDTEAPVVNNLTVNGQSHNIEVTAGSGMSVSADLADDTDLKSVQIAIAAKESGAEKWSQGTTIDLSGSKYSLDETFNIPTDVWQGTYQVEVQVTDANGNLGGKAVKDFRIVRGQGPVINVTHPAIDSTASITVGNILKIEGNITDNSDLSIVRLHMDIPDYPGATALYDREIELDGGGHLYWDFQQHGQVEIDVPQNAVRGPYRITITATDSDGLIENLVFWVQVKS